MSSYISWYADLWTEEKLTLQAFRSLLGLRRFFGVPENQTLEAMIAASAQDQHEVTDQLGATELDLLAGAARARRVGVDSHVGKSTRANRGRKRPRRLPGLRRGPILGPCAGEARRPRHARFRQHVQQPRILIVDPAGAAALPYARLAARLQPLEVPGLLIGSVSLSQISRGPFQNAMLGYAIDAAHEGRGLMREALQAVVAHAFSPSFNLHRIQANVRPENRRSVALVKRLGFEDEGLARDYLYIDGAWRDHRMFALRNAAFVGVPQ